MIPDILIKREVFGIASTAISGATPQVNGNPVNMNGVKVASLACYVRLRLTTTSLAMTLQWQVKNKAGNWIDIAHAANNPAAVAFATGTGSVVVTEKVFSCPDMHGFSQIRAVVRGTGASGGGAGVDDVQALAYCYTDPFDGY